MKSMSHGVESTNFTDKLDSLCNNSAGNSSTLVDDETQRSSILRRSRIPIPQGAVAAQTNAAVPVINHMQMNKVSKQQMFDSVLNKAQEIAKIFNGTVKSESSFSICKGGLFSIRFNC